MADISRDLQAILDAIYGEEVRGSIHDAIAAMNQESSNAMQYASTAKDSAQASAASAASYATTAGTKANEAAAKANAAQTSANNAAASERAAAASEENAAASELRAKQYADSAADTIADGVAKALASETAARAAESGAKTAQNEAEAAKAASESAQEASENNAAEAARSAKSAKEYSGKPPMPINGTWWIWDPELYQSLLDDEGNVISDSEDGSVETEYPGYIDTHISCELEGPQGVGIQDISQISGDHTPGTTDVYSVILTDGRSYPISVYNGKNGEGTGDVSGIYFELIIPANGWSDGTAVIADERLLASVVYKYFVTANAAGRGEYLRCQVEPSDITEAGFITFTCGKTPETDIGVRVLRFEFAANG